MNFCIFEHNQAQWPSAICPETGMGAIIETKLTMVLCILGTEQGKTYGSTAKVAQGALFQRWRGFESHSVPLKCKTNAMDEPNMHSDHTQYVISSLVSS